MSSPMTDLTRYEIFRQFDRWKRLSLQKRIPSVRNLPVPELIAHADFSNIMKVSVGNVRYEACIADNRIEVSKVNEKDTCRYVDTKLRKSELKMNLMSKLLCEKRNTILKLKFYVDNAFLLEFSPLKVTATIDTLELNINNFDLSPQDLKVFPRSRALSIILGMITQEWIQAIHEINPLELSIFAGYEDVENLNFQTLTSKVLKIKFSEFNFYCFAKLAKKLASGAHSAESECKVLKFSDDEPLTKQTFNLKIREAFHEHRDEIIENEDNLSILMPGDLLLRVWLEGKGCYCRVEKRYSSSEALTSSSRYEIFRQFKRSKRLILQKRIPSLRNLKVIPEIIQYARLGESSVKIGDVHYLLEGRFTISGGSSDPTTRIVRSQLTWQELVTNLWKTFFCQKEHTIEHLQIEDRLESCRESLGVTTRVNKLRLEIGNDEKRKTLSPLVLNLFPTPRVLTVKIGSMTQEWIQAINTLNPPELKIEISDQASNWNFELTSKKLEIKIEHCTFKGLVQVAKTLPSHSVGSICKVDQLIGDRKFDLNEEFNTALREAFQEQWDGVIVKNGQLEAPISEDLFLRVKSFNNNANCQVVRRTTCDSTPSSLPQENRTVRRQPFVMGQPRRFKVSGFNFP